MGNQSAVARIDKAVVADNGQLSLSRGDRSRPLLEMTIGEALSRAAELWPSVDALVSPAQNVRWSFAELDDRATQLAKGLMGIGLRRGDRVAVWGPNSAEWTLLQFATAKAGLIFVTFNTAYRSVELSHVLALSGARAIVHARGFKDINYIDELAGLDAPALEFRIILDGPVPPRYLGFADLLTAGGEWVEPAIDANDPVNIQFTSGTTGRPKAVTLSHSNILNNGAAVGFRTGIRTGDRICIPVPLFHCFGMVMGNLACIAHGATMIYPAETFGSAPTLRAIEQENCTHCYGVPTMFIAMLNDPGFAAFDLTSLRGGIMAGTTCPVEVMRRVIDEMHMGEVTIAYGMTETSPVSTQTFSDDTLEERVGTVGHVLPHLDVKIVDAAGAIVPTGVQGELCTRGYSVMLGYWNDPEATAAVIDDAGFMHSGDLATMDASGFVRITGRSKDMIIRGGENISPREIEEYLYRNPDIVDVAVIGLPDFRFGEVVCAWIVAREGAALTVDMVKAFCQGRLAHYKIPTKIRFVECLPMTGSGKIQKYQMREFENDQLETLGKN